MSMIHQDVNELQTLNQELKRLNAQIRSIRDQKRQCEQRILQYLNTSNLPGLRIDKDTVILPQFRKKRKYQNRRDKLLKGEDVLRRYGIEQSQEVLSQLMEEMRGDVEEYNALRIQNV